MQIKNAWGLNTLFEQRKQQEALKKKKQQEALEKKKQQEALEKKKQQEALERKKQQEALERKKQQEALEKKKQQEVLEKIKQKDVRKNHYQRQPEISVTHSNTGSAKVADQNISSIDLSLHHFEFFASHFQQSYMELTCNFIQNYFPYADGDNHEACLRGVLSNVRELLGNGDDHFRFLFAFASIRKAQQDYYNWIENLCWAYEKIPNNEYQKIRQNQVKKELALAKMYMYNNKLDESNIINLRNVGLLNEWRQVDFIKRYVDYFYSPEDAKAKFHHITCNDNYETKITNLQKLLTTYRFENDNIKRLDYTDIFNRFISKCNNVNEKKFWVDAWFKN